MAKRIRVLDSVDGTIADPVDSTEVGPDDTCNTSSKDKLISDASGDEDRRSGQSVHEEKGCLTKFKRCIDTRRSPFTDGLPKKIATITLSMVQVKRQNEDKIQRHNGGP